MKKAIVILILLLSPALYAKGIRDYPKHQFGLGYSTISGAGLSYQITLSRLWSAKINGFAYYLGKNPPDDLDLYFEAGAELQYNIMKRRDERIYLLGGMSRWYFEERSPIIIKENDLEIKKIQKDIGRMTNIGFGIGYEIIFGNAALSFDFGFQWQASDKTDFNALFDRNPAGTEHFGIGGGIGIRYYFD